MTNSYEEEQQEREHYDALTSVEESCKQGVFSFVTHWMMSVETPQARMNCVEWLRGLADEFETKLSEQENN